MLDGSKLRAQIKERKVSLDQLAGQLVRGGLDKKAAASAIKNWQRRLYTPIPRKEDIDQLASALGVEAADISRWQSSYIYAPIAPRKARLVTQLISNRPVQDALDTLRFANKRAASMVNKVLKTAIADADESQADVESLIVSEARVDGAGVRIGTKRFIEKDRGRAHSIRKEASHIHVTVTKA
jgi:large subunit ribosomal protein L22